MPAAPLPPPTSEQAETVLRFLESVGRRAEAEFYVQLFRAGPKEQFGAIFVDASVARHATEAVVLHLKFLAGLGLAPLTVLGAFEPGDASDHAARIVRRLERQGIAAALVPAGDVAAMSAEVVRLCRAAVLPVLALTTADGETVDARFATLGAVLAAIASRKLIVLHRRGGLQQNGALLPLVNLSADVPSLLASRELTRKERAIVAQAARLVASSPASRLAVTITSPLNLLRELFTVKGAGTLLRRGAAILRFDGYAGVDLARLRALVVSSFGREPVADFFERPVLRVYVEEQYRGCAILTDSPHGPYLTKFATDREARGEGIARDLWDAFSADFGSVYWRARSANPINEWYTRLADGIVKTPEWWVFWKGLDLARVPELVGWALARPIDLPAPASGAPAALP
jgi:acetylglutamate kinase